LAKESRSFFDRWKEKARNLKKETYALYLVYRNPLTPWYAKVLTGIIVAYAFSPIDLIPDFIPILGYLDDLILIPLGIALVIKMIPQGIMNECRQQAQIEMSGEKPVNWFAAGIIILIWAGLAAWAISKAVELFR